MPLLPKSHRKTVKNGSKISKSLSSGFLDVQWPWCNCSDWSIGKCCKNLSGFFAPLLHASGVLNAWRMQQVPQPRKYELLHRTGVETCHGCRGGSAQTTMISTLLHCLPMNSYEIKTTYRKPVDICGPQEPSFTSHLFLRHRCVGRWTVLEAMSLENVTSDHGIFLNVHVFPRLVYKWMDASFSSWIPGACPHPSAHEIKHLGERELECLRAHSLRRSQHVATQSSPFLACLWFAEPRASLIFHSIDIRVGPPWGTQKFTVRVKRTGLCLGDACNRSERMDTLASKGVACGLQVVDKYIDNAYLLRFGVYRCLSCLSYFWFGIILLRTR